MIDGGIVRWDTLALLHEADIVVAIYEDSFTGEMFVNWLEKTFADIKNREDATERGRKLFREGLIGDHTQSFQNVS